MSNIWYSIPNFQTDEYDEFLQFNNSTPIIQYRPEDFHDVPHYVGGIIKFLDYIKSVHPAFPRDTVAFDADTGVITIPSWIEDSNIIDEVKLYPNGFLNSNGHSDYYDNNQLNMYYTGPYQI